MHHKPLVAHGLKPQLQTLDNKASKALKSFIKSEGIEYQLVPPHVHHRNAANCAIGTWKNHFIASLCSTDKLFPTNLWDHLLFQVDPTLNLL